MTHTKDEALHLALKALRPFSTPNWAGTGVDKANEAITAIKQALAQPEPVQEPVYLVEDDFGLFRITTKGDWNFYNVTVPGVKKTLIANATPPAQPAVPDAIHHTDLSESLEYIQGWNDCRQAMLEMMK